MASKSKSSERFSFGSLPEVVEMPNLLDIQKVSFANFLQEGLAETFKDISPIEDFHGNLSLELEYDPTDDGSFEPIRRSRAIRWTAALVVVSFALAGLSSLSHWW